MRLLVYDYKDARQQKYIKHMFSNEKQMFFKLSQDLDQKNS